MQLESTQTFDCSDKLVLTKLYEELRPYALKKCHYMLGDLAMAQDVVQDVFLKMWNARVIFNSIGAAYKWVYQSCHNAAIDRLRKAKRQTTYVNAELSLTSAEVMTPDDRIANQRLIEQILPQFSDREAAVLAYLAIDRLTHREIADLMDVSIKTIQRTVAVIEQKLSDIRRRQR